MNRQSGPPAAIVLGLNPNGLGIVKSLVAHGISVLAVDERPAGWGDTHRWMSSRTCLCRKVLLPRGSHPDGVLRALLDLAPSCGGQRPVLIPSGDAEMLLVADNRHLLAQHYRFRVPTPAALDLFVRKVGFEEYCHDQGVPMPATAWNVTSDSLAQAVRAIRFPCIVKPEFRDHRWDRLFLPRKSLPAADLVELTSVVADAERSGVPLVIQEIIPGPDSLLHFSHVYLDGESRVVQGWTGHKVRQLPIHFGTSTLAETVDDDEVMDLTLRLLRPQAYHGYASVEFKRDPRDNRLRVMEVTVARTWYPHLLGLAAGVNIPLAWYRDAAGLPQEPRRSARVPVRWIDEYRDVLATADYLRAGELSLRTWIGSFRHLRGFALFSLRDPLPGLLVVARLGISAANIARRALRRLLDRRGGGRVAGRDQAGGGGGGEPHR
jgi:predicted ATP-grasp superfamily ATP-dependent carboligase